MSEESLVDIGAILNTKEEPAEEETIDEIGEEAYEMMKSAAIELVKEKEPNILELVESYKKEHGNIFLYIFSAEEYYFFRPMKRIEFKKIQGMESTSELDKEDRIVATCVVHPKGISVDTMNSGSIRTLCEMILYYSNFGSNKPVIEF